MFPGRLSSSLANCLTCQAPLVDKLPVLQTRADALLAAEPGWFPGASERRLSGPPARGWRVSACARWAPGLWFGGQGGDSLLTGAVWHLSFVFFPKLFSRSLAVLALVSKTCCGGDRFK